MYADYVGHDNFYGWLASQRGRLFCDEDFAELYCHSNGRPSVPPSLLATALVLQTHDGVSDEEAKARADYDLRWKVALGIEIKDRPFAKSTLQLFRSKLIIHDKVRLIFRRSLESARQNGFLKYRKKLHVAVDTMAILGAAAVKDTYNLLADGITALIRALADVEGQKPEPWAEARGLERYFAGSIKGTEEVDWDDEDSRRAFLAGIVAEADRLLETARTVRSRHEEGGEEDRRIREAAELLGELLCQDIERREDGPDIRQGVAKDRIISVQDPVMRHGHKSSKGRFDGHKGAIGVDTPSQLITATGAEAANSYDGDTGLPLTEQSEENTGMEVADTVGDCSFGDGETRREFHEADRKLEAPVPAPPKNGKIPKSEFRVSPKLDRVTCPAGRSTTRWHWTRRRANRKGHRPRVKTYLFGREDCAGCPLKQSCVGDRDGPRSITLHPQEIEMRRARRHQATKAFGEAKRRRQVVEHRIARLRQLGLRKARYFGHAKLDFQLMMAATVANLTLVAGKCIASGAESALSGLRRIANGLWVYFSRPLARKCPTPEEKGPVGGPRPQVKLPAPASIALRQNRAFRLDF